MLGARAESADEQSDQQQAETGAQADQTVSEARERRSERQHRGRAEPLRQVARRNLEARHRAGIEPAQHSKLGIAQAEIALPQRQHDVDQIGVAVMQCMRAARHAGGAPFLALGIAIGSLVHRGQIAHRARFAGDRHVGGTSTERRSTKAVLTNDTTTSPCWFLPVLSDVTNPQPGHFGNVRFSITSV